MNGNHFKFYSTVNISAKVCLAVSLWLNYTVLAKRIWMTFGNIYLSFKIFPYKLSHDATGTVGRSSIIAKLSEAFGVLTICIRQIASEALVIGVGTKIHVGSRAAGSKRQAAHAPTALLHPDSNLPAHLTHAIINRCDQIHICMFHTKIRNPCDTKPIRVLPSSVRFKVFTG